MEGHFTDISYPSLVLNFKTCDFKDRKEMKWNEEKNTHNIFYLLLKLKQNVNARKIWETVRVGK